ncbi:MAG TPA: SDR family oxidoreductase [Actinomycetota bacterium]|nr:SDR family oxidoreductase [Actinomycetota bacterium]
MGGVILLTGATGFLGTQVARRLLERTDHDLVALVQAPDQATARRRLLRAWWDWPELAHAVDGEWPRWPVTVGAAGWRSWPAASPTSSTPPPTYA